MSKGYTIIKWVGIGIASLLILALIAWWIVSMCLMYSNSLPDDYSVLIGVGIGIAAFLAIFMITWGSIMIHWLPDDEIHISSYSGTYRHTDITDQDAVAINTMTTTIINMP